MKPSDLSEREESEGASNKLKICSVFIFSLGGGPGTSGVRIQSVGDRWGDWGGLAWYILLYITYIG